MVYAFFKKKSTILIPVKYRGQTLGQEIQLMKMETFDRKDNET